MLHGLRWVVFSNERSAEEATLTDHRGQAVNHQYSKSLDFERRFRAQSMRACRPGWSISRCCGPWARLPSRSAFSVLTALPRGIFQL